MLLLALCIIYIKLLNVSCNEECTKVLPASKISSLLSLEKSIVCDEYNLQSLTEAFFPPNRRQPYLIQVHYYVNRTVHPLQLIPGTEYSNTTTSRPADYELLWFSSSVFVFVEPWILEKFSVFSLYLEFSHTHLRIAPFISDDKDWIRGLLTNATIWVSHM